MAWMRSRLSAPSQGSKGKGKGKGQAKPKPKGASQGVPPPATATQASSEGPARRRPNLKPNEERATPTLIEIKCQKCQAYNWTSRELCRSCETPLARLPGISSSSTQPLQPAARPLGTTPGKSYADAAAGSPPASQSVLALDKESLQTPGGIGDCHRNLAGRIPSQDGAFHSVGLRQREAEGPQAAGSQARLGDSRGEEGHRQAGKGRRNPEAGAGGFGTSPSPGDQGYPRTGGCQSCSSPTSTSGNPPAGLCVLVVRRCSRTYLLLPRACGRKGGRARRRASLQEGPSRTLWGDPEPQGDKRRGSARKIGKGAGLFGLHAESEFEIWGWVLPGSHPRNSLPERLWQRQWRCSRSECRTSQRPSASPCPCSREGKGSHPAHPGGRRHCNAGCSGQVASPLLRGCGGPIWLCSFLCLLAQMWLDVSFFAACQTEPTSITWSSCPATMTMIGVPSQHDAAACKPACSIQCSASVRGNAIAEAPLGSPLPGSWSPTTESRQVSCTCPPHSHLPGSMTIKKTMGTVEVISHMTQNLTGYQAQTSHYHAPCYGRMPGISAHAPGYVCTCQGQDERDLLCFVKLPGSFHSHCVCSQGGSTSPCEDAGPLSESSGELSGNLFPSALPVCHLGLPGSAEMADSRMASPAAAPGRLSIASVGMRHVEKNHRTGTQILPGSISGFYHRDRYQAARQVLERCFRA